MHPQLFDVIPTETARVARAAFPKGGAIMQIRDELGMRCAEQDFAALFSAVGQPALSPSRLRRITIFQFVDQSARQAAHRGHACLGRHADAQSGGMSGRNPGPHPPPAPGDAPGWAHATRPADWWARYAARFDAVRLPRTAPQQAALAERIGRDGQPLLHWVQASPTPPEVPAHPAVALLRQVWIQPFAADPTAIRLRTVADRPPAARLIGAPYAPDARLRTKRDTTGNGSKVHLTETCDADGPNLITDVQTTPATTPDGPLTVPIQAALAPRQRLPAEQSVDCADTDAATIIHSQATQAIDLVGPVQRDGSWQAQAGAGFAGACFAVDWDATPVVCPQGQPSRGWSASTDTAGQAVIHGQFDRHVCGACGVREACPKAKRGPRTLKLRPQPQDAALQAARQYQKTDEFKQRYRVRAGIEGTITQGVQAFDLRYARYRGLAKTSLQHILTVLAMNLTRLVAWWDARPKAQTRPARFTAGLRHAATAPCGGT